MNDMQRELQLFRETLDWIKSKEFKNKEPFVTYYDRYYQLASTHTPLVNEDWNKEGCFRYGTTNVKGTTSEMLTAFYCIVEQQWKIHQIDEKAQQTWGSDILITRGIKQDKISVKSTKPKPVFIDGKLDTRLTLYREYFKPATWRIGLISLVHPDTKQIWMFNYEALATKFCDINDKGYCRPKFDPYAHLFINQFEAEYPNCTVYHDLRTFK